MSDAPVPIELTTPLEPVRREPRHASEMISEVRAGEWLTRIDVDGEWWLVEGEDDYVGWMHSWVGRESSEDARLEQLTRRMGHFTDPVGTLWVSDHHAAGPLTLGTPLLRVDAPLTERGEWTLVQTAWGGEGWLETSKIDMRPPSSSLAVVLDRARALVGTPYRWGGRSPHGFDCSGFVQYVFALGGTALPRDASQQQRWGDAMALDDQGEWQAGDLLFFGEPADHVGLYDGRGGMIHCSGGVKREALREMPQRLERLTHVRRRTEGEPSSSPTLWRPKSMPTEGA